MNNTNDHQFYWDGESPIHFGVKEFNDCLIWATTQINANDVFFETGEPIGIKKDGFTYNVTKKPLAREVLVFILSEIYQDSADSELRSGNDLDFLYSFSFGKDEVLRFRVNVTACTSLQAADEGFEIVMRPTDGIPPSVKELGVTDDILSVCEQPEGLVLVTGPTGSGKTTLIASCFRHIIETQRKHVLTGESPIEFLFKLIPNRLARIVQSEVPLNVKTFQDYVRGILRRSPDVILFGELRDNESIEGAVLASQTGHLVWATGHTNDVASSLERMTDGFPAGDRDSKLNKIVSSIKAIFHQRLLQRRGGGRVAIQERLLITNQTRMKLFSALNKGNGTVTVLQECIASDGLLLKDDIKTKFCEGLLDVSECIKQLALDLTSDDINFFTMTTSNLRDKGIITIDEFTQWSSELELLNERL